MTYHEWSEWVDPKHPVTGPVINWAKIDTFVFHYTAAINLPDGDFGESKDDLPGYMRRVQMEYLGRTPPYSIGYNEAADWLGGIWKARGPEIKCAANINHNDHTYAMLMLVDWQDPATDLCVAAVKLRYAEACKRAGQARGKRWFQLAQVGHQNLAPTGCPGTGVMQQIKDRQFLVTENEMYPTPIPTPQEDELMFLLWRDPRFNNVFRIGDDAITISQGLVDAHVAAGGPPPIVEAHDQTLIACMRKSRLTMAQMSPHGTQVDWPAGTQPFSPPADLK